jgi:hypothetical protein
MVTRQTSNTAFTAWTHVDEAVSAKARDLMAPVLGSEKTERLIDQVNNLERVDDIRMLRALFAI